MTTHDPTTSSSDDGHAASPPAEGSDRWADVDALFAAALEHAPGTRERFVREACGEDGELRDEVLELLHSAEDAEGYLERPADLAGPLWAELVERHEGEGTKLKGVRIGAYRVVREIGSGGMATVYMAERDDGRFEQQVAIKVLRPGFDSGDVLQRFLAERRILAELEHPNIGRLLDGGETEDGRPFLVMEYVRGEPIDVYCDRHGLGLDARLGLVATVCDAVRHAHRSLIVHRDLKPSNILVTDEGRVTLLDFGIAKLVDASQTAARTRTGMAFLTPEYASPEQVSGAGITTATDVYQLGVLLYRLLTGRLPYTSSGDSLAGVAHAITAEEPERPSVAADATDPPPAGATAPVPLRHLRRGLRSDLDAIVLKALRKDPAHRYAAVDDLARDLDRFRQGLPVEARKGDRRYRAAKFLRRHRFAVPAAALFVALIGAYLVTVSIYAERLASERNAARLAATRAERVADVLTGLFRLTAPDSGRGNSITAREMLDGGTERVLDELRQQPALQAEVLATLVDSYDALGLHVEAARVASRTLDARVRAHGPDHPAVVDDLVRLASVLAWTPRDTVLALYETALQRAERAFGPGHPKVAEVLTSFAEESGRGVEGSPDPTMLHARAIRILRNWDGDVRSQLADALKRSTYGSLAPIDERVGRLVEALEIYRNLHGEEHPEVAETLSDLALNLQYDDPVAADTLLRRAVAIHTRTMGESHPGSLVLMNNLAAILRDQGRYAEAEPVYRKVLRIRRSAYTEDTWQLAYPLYGLGIVLLELDRPEEAEPLLREALPIFPESDGRHRSIGTVLARTLTAQQRFREAEAMLLDVQEAAVRAEGDITEPVRALAELYDAWGRPSRAERVRARLDSLTAAPIG